MRSFLVDTNLLVLLVVGLTSEALILRHKKTKIFTLRDYELLSFTLGPAPFTILPNVASEASNLLAFHEESGRKQLFTTFRRLIERCEETMVESRTAARQSEFIFAGLSDAAILCAADDKTIITTDSILFHSALKRGLDAVNFNHLRDHDRF